jgi:hypothetical protein
MPRIEGLTSPSPISKKENAKGKLLQHEVCALSVKDLYAHRLQGQMWKIAAAAFVVGFILLSTVGNLLLSFYTPYYFFIAALITFALMPTIPPVAKWMLKKADENQNLGLIDRAVHTKFEKLNKKSGSEIKEKLSRCGFDPKKIKKSNHLNSIKDINAGFARYLIWEKQPKSIKSRKKELSREVKKLKDPVYIKAHQLKILDLKHRVKKEAKERIAHFRHLIKHPLKQPA